MNAIVAQADSATEWAQDKKEFFDHVASAVHCAARLNMPFHEAVRHFAIMLHALCPDEEPRSLGESLDV